MVVHMKTTIEISDALLHEAQEFAREHRVTLRSLVEAGLRSTLAARRQGATFTLRDASVDGDGLRPEFQGASWADIRDAAYGNPA
ncbi:type II toxin-antitoxin system VapB family antitoxin [Nocardia cyriacigeorgica]|nr:type II toxin-antitoxin system VapB family antitoxin [Nocardia cyriacigeorgica]